MSTHRLHATLVATFAASVFLFTGCAGESSGELDRAQIALDAGRSDEALRLALNHLARTNARDPRATRIAARSLLRSGHPERAEIYYARLTDPTPEDLHDRALGLLQLGRPQDAATILESILRTEPNDPHALQRLAAIRLSESRHLEAAELGERLARLSDFEIRGLTLQASALSQARRHDAAIAAYDRILALDPRLETMPLPRPRFWADYAMSLLAFGRATEAREHLLRALERDPSAELMELVGLSLQQEGRIPEAETWWLRAVERDPSLIDAWLGLGRVALQDRRLDLALERFRKAVEIESSSIEAHHGLAQVHAAAGRPVEAAGEAALARSLREAPKTGSRLIFTPTR
ncbi:MAG: tetratricopeptide repeat protein [Isosphaeraceae bacterium]|nr:tetratricopeptide repeat protein [Isosphaeraceae bacterium]